MPNRVIKESCRASKTLDQISAEAERLFWRLTTVADDFGRFESEPIIILAACFPRRVDTYTPAAVAGWYGELERAGLVQSYSDGDRQLGYFKKWLKHQSCRAKESKFPEPQQVNAVLQASASSCEQMSPYSGSGSGTGSGTRTRTGSGTSRAREPEPTAGSLRASASGDPKPNPDPDPPPVADLEAGDRIDALRRRLHQRDPRGAGRLDRLIAGYVGRAGPPGVLIAALESAIEYQARDSEAYVAKILRVQEPNYHEAQAIANAKANGEPMSFGQIFAGMGSSSQGGDRVDRTVETTGFSEDSDADADAG